MLGLNEEEIRVRLSGKALGYFNDITKKNILGAMRSIKAIFNMYMDIAEKASPEDDTEFIVTTTAGFFKKTRGESSVAISNAINMLLSNMKGEGDFGERLIVSLREIIKKIERANDIITSYTFELLTDESIVMLFDYSSTVGSLASYAKEKGVVINSIIPESRVIDGGRPFVKQFSDCGHKVHMIPDAAIFKYMQECDMAFIGAETILPDGSTYNTVGSDMTAVSCRVLGKPFYVMSSMIKVDQRGFEGYEKPLTMKDCSALFDIPGSMCYDLVKVEPGDITAIITENGIISTKDFYEESKKYFEGMKKL